jgi:ADP-heptose:LPS heptosyltransferase
MKRLGGWALHENEERAADYEYSFFQVYRKRDDQQHIDLTTGPKPAKTAALVRSGNFGDALWAGSVAKQLKADGYHVTCYVGPLGQAVLDNDPNIDRLIVLDDQALPPTEWGKLFESERKRYDRWINFIHTAEIEILKTADQLSFFWPDELRRKVCDRNYVEFMHQVAGLPYELGVRFFPTDAENDWAREQRKEFDGRLVVLANGGSTVPKWWPYAPAFVALLAELGIRTVIMGDLKGLVFPSHPLVHVMGTEKWSIRQSIAFAKLATAVVGQETGVLNALCLESVPKVVMLSHSSVNNLTRDWVNTRSLSGAVPCYPCHQVHYTHQYCPQDETTKAAKCQAAITIEQAMDALTDLGVLTAADFDKLAAPAAERIEEPA